MRVNKHYAFLLAYFISIILAITSVVVYFLSFPNLSDINLSYLDKSQEIVLPYKEDTNTEIKTFTLSLHVSHNILNSGYFHITPDDCLTQLYVNEKRVDLSVINKSRLCDYQKGFEIDLNAYLKKDKNKLVLILRDAGGKRGVNITPVIQGKAEQFLSITFSIWIFLTAFIIMQKLKFSLSIAILFSLGMALRVAYMMETPWSVRTHDVDGHIDYIVFIVTHGYIPDSIACWTCYHPPLYYIIASGFYKFGLLFSKSMALVGVQIFSLFLTSGFLVFMLLIFRIMIKNSTLLIVISMLAIFFPSSIIHSVRIGNDAMLYFTYAGAFYFYLKWLKTDKGILISTLFAVASIFVKANGVIIMAVLGISYLIRMFQLKQLREKRRTVLTIAGVYIFAVILALGLHVSRGETSLVSNASGLNSRLGVNSSAINYLYFDPKIMIEQAYTDPWKDGKGRQYFWNYFWQTSLFGEFHYSDTYRYIASLMSFIYIGLLLTAFFGLSVLRRKDMIRWWPFIVNGFILIAAAIYLRISIPVSCSNDFRYSVPLLFSLFLFIGNFLEFLRQKEYVFLQWSIYILIASFSILSSIFILSLV